jgi:hypothetical protein
VPRTIRRYQAAVDPFVQHCGVNYVDECRYIRLAFRSGHREKSSRPPHGGFRAARPGTRRWLGSLYSARTSQMLRQTAGELQMIFSCLSETWTTDSETTVKRDQTQALRIAGGILAFLTSRQIPSSRFPIVDGKTSILHTRLRFLC